MPLTAQVASARMHASGGRLRGERIAECGGTRATRGQGHRSETGKTGSSRGIP